MSDIKNADALIERIEKVLESSGEDRVMSVTLTFTITPYGYGNKKIGDIKVKTEEE